MRTTNLARFSTISVLALLLLGLPHTLSHAQAVQAVRGVIRTMPEVKVDSQSEREKMLINATEVRTVMAYLSGPVQEKPTLKWVVDAIKTTADRILDPHRDRNDSTLRIDYEIMGDYLEGLTGLLANAKAADSLTLQVDSATVQNVHGLLTTARAQSIPRGYARHFPEVNFAVGYGFSAAGSRKTVNGFSIGTNLAGAAAGEAFGGLGFDALKKYFIDNTSMGVALPVSSEAKPSLDVGLGLGELRFGNAMLWPVLGFQQFNKGDSRVPDEVVASNSDQSTWSAPYAGLSMFFGSIDDARKQLDSIGTAWSPIVSLGLELPFYYPGGAFSAMGALFTDRIGDYSREGTIGFFLSLSWPLMPIVPQDQAQAGNGK